MSKSFRTQGGLTLVFILLCSFGATVLHAQTAALTVQGILKKADGSAVPDETYTVRFALFDADMGGNEVWFEQLTDVETIGGVYSVVLGTHGKTLNAPFNKDYYLSVKIGNSSQELLPRPRLTPAPYAMTALAFAGGTVNGNLTVNGQTTFNNTVELIGKGILGSVGPIDNGNGPFYGYGFKGDGTTGYGSNSHGVASIWAGTANVINATNQEITMNKHVHITGSKTTSYNGIHMKVLDQSVFQSSIWTSQAISLVTDDNIVADGLFAVSDRRIKKDFTASNAAGDLSRLLRLKVTNYKYKDVIGKGDTWKKGFIAQEVEEIVPEAIFTNTNIIPDIYALAQNTRLETGALHLTMEKSHDLNVGDKVRIMAGDRQEDLPVTAVASATEFSLGNWNHTAPEKVFVYGREVNDFHSVDYDHLFTLNISATQELARKVEALEKENAAAKAENAELRRLIEGIRADVNTLRGEQR